MQFYQRVDTSKLPHVPTILAQYSTEDLLAALTARYGPDNLPRARVLPPAERAAEAKMQARALKAWAISGPWRATTTPGPRRQPR